MSEQIANKETLGFQTEVSQLLHLVTHSLYSNKEIFLRELVSNASDALDKLRFEALSQGSLYESDPTLAVKIEFDKDAKTVTISDNGIGMNREEIISHLGTIAKSGTREFLAKIGKEKAKDSNFIGQFGVGFYSSFIVADKVTVRSRRAGLAPTEGVEWISNGTDSFEVANYTKENRGTEIILHLKEEEGEFLDGWRLRNIVRKYSDNISFPIMMHKEEMPKGDEDKNEKKDEIVIPEFEAVNRAQALWTLPKNKITDDQYKEFYKHISHDFQDPLLWSHNRVEGKMEYTSLLYLPTKAPFDLFNRDIPTGLKLYVQRVFIMDNADKLLPMYLRFVKGVIDSNDLPLNISREILQSNQTIDTLRTATAKRVLEMLEKLASEDKEKYAQFWKEFGSVLKEGVVEDFAHREKIAKLLRFSTTNSASDVADVSLEEYVTRMKPGQDKIYYVTGESYNSAKGSPHLEIFKKKGIEVLVLHERVDEWLVAHLHEFEGKALQSVAQGDLSLGSLENEAEKEENKKVEEQYTDFVTKIKDILKDEVKDVRITHRLTDSPACIVADDNDLGGNLQRILKAAGQEIPTSKPILEVNPKHPLILRLKEQQDKKQLSEWSQILLGQALLAEGGQLEDPATFIRRLNNLWENLL